MLILLMLKKGFGPDGVLTLHLLPMTWDHADTLFQSHERYPEYGDYAVHRPRQIDNIWLVKDGQSGQMRLDSCHRLICYDDPYSAPNHPNQWFDSRTAISDHHAIIATIQIQP